MGIFATDDISENLPPVDDSISGLVVNRYNLDYSLFFTKLHALYADISKEFGNNSGYLFGSLSPYAQIRAIGNAVIKKSQDSKYVTFLLAEHYFSNDSDLEGKHIHERFLDLIEVYFGDVIINGLCSPNTCADFNDEGDWSAFGVDRQYRQCILRMPDNMSEKQKQDYNTNIEFLNNNYLTTENRRNVSSRPAANDRVTRTMDGWYRAMTGINDYRIIQDPF